MKYSVLENVKLKTSKGDLELLPGELATLPYKVANKLLNEGRIAPCDIALKPISGEMLQDVYLKTMNKINDSYIEGTIKYIEDHHKELDIKIDEVDKQINVIWESCLQGKAGLDDFKAELASYKSLYMHGIELFRVHLTKEDGNSKDENEILCIRCGKPGKRFCYGEDKSGEYKFGDFFLVCRPY